LHEYDVGAGRNSSRADRGVEYQDAGPGISLRGTRDKTPRGGRSRAMSDAPGPTGGFVRGTVAAGRERPGVGIVWLDSLTLVAGDGNYPSFGPRVAVVRSVPAQGRAAPTERLAQRALTATVGATVEVPPGYLVVDVRVGYATAAGGFVGELRIVDLRGHRKSALLLLERRPAPDDPAASLFVDASRAPAGKRTFLSIRASVPDRAEHVAVRSLTLCLTRG
jgi:hypothetical protein